MFTVVPGIVFHSDSISSSLCRLATQTYLNKLILKIKSAKNFLISRFFSYVYANWESNTIEEKSGVMMTRKKKKCVWEKFRKNRNNASREHFSVYIFINKYD